MSVQFSRHLFSVADYCKLAEIGLLKPSDRVELINGEIIEMSPIKSRHASIVDQLFEEFVFQLRSKATIRSQNPIRLNDYSEPEPDLVVVQYRKDKYRYHHPTPAEVLLLVEVADTSLAYDQQIKLSLYAEAGIPEYWIINLNENQLEIYSFPEGSSYQKKEIHAKMDSIHHETLRFKLDLGKILGD